MWFIYKCIYACLYASVYLYVRMYLVYLIYVCMYVYRQLCMYVCMYVCALSVYMYVYVFLSVCMYLSNLCMYVSNICNVCMYVGWYFTAFFWGCGTMYVCWRRRCHCRRPCSELRHPSSTPTPRSLTISLRPLSLGQRRLTRVCMYVCSCMYVRV